MIAKNVKFIILGYQRTGTSVINEAIAQHPELKIAKEVLNARPTEEISGINIQNYLQKIYNISSFALQPREHGFLDSFFLRQDMLDEAPHDLSKFIEIMLSEYNGFKIIYDQIANTNVVWSYLQQYKNLKVIHLIRRNYLEILISLHLSRQTNIWNTAKMHSFSFPPRKLTVNCQKLSMFFEHLEQQTEYFDKMFNNHDILHINYQSIFQWQETMNRIQQFLEIPVRELSAKFIKMNHNHFYWIENFDEVKNYFKNSKWNYMFKTGLFL